MEHTTPGSSVQTCAVSLSHLRRRIRLVLVVFLHALQFGKVSMPEDTLGEAWT